MVRIAWDGWVHELHRVLVKFELLIKSQALNSDNLAMSYLMNDTWHVIVYLTMKCDKIIIYILEYIY